MDETKRTPNVKLVCTAGVYLKSSESLGSCLVQFRVRQSFSFLYRLLGPVDQKEISTTVKTRIKEPLFSKSG